MDFNWEMTLPPYLKHDIEALEEARKQETLPTYYDCLLDELQGSIDSSMWANEISREQAAQLREKYMNYYTGHGIVPTIQQIKEIAAPIAQKHKLSAVYLFGPYAWGTADKNSPVGLIVDADLAPSLELSPLQADFERAFNRSIKIFALDSFSQSEAVPYDEASRRNILQERIQIYPSYAGSQG